MGGCGCGFGGGASPLILDHSARIFRLCRGRASAVRCDKCRVVWQVPCGVGSPGSLSANLTMLPDTDWGTL